MDALDSKNKEKIVVVGFGWVGQANALALSLMGYSVAYFDPANPPHHYALKYGQAYESVPRLSSVLAIDSPQTYYLVCVGDKVAEDGVQDISAIHIALVSLKDAEGVVILRSTILPDVLEELPFDYYLPEFLHEKKAVEECLKPHFFVLGANGKKKKPSFFTAWRRQTPLQFDGTPREAAFVKYLSNLWNATRITFVNEYGDAVGVPASPHDVESISRVVNFVLGGEGYTRYGRSFGGHCLPKDTRAFIKWFGEHGKGVELLRGVYASNDAHRKVEERYPILPQWFSGWQTPHISGVIAGRELWFALLKNLSDPRDFMRRHWRSLTIITVIILLTDSILLVIK